MNQIERIRNDLAKRFPDLAIDLDSPANESNPWFLIVQRGAEMNPVVVEWRPDRGFGISTPGEYDYGVGVDEIYTNAKAALERAVSLIESGESSEPPQSVRLAELRLRQGLSQAELAERAGVRQANISRIESRNDVLVSTLAKLATALGGELSIQVRFPGGTKQELAFDFPDAELRIPEN